MNARMIVPVTGVVVTTTLATLAGPASGSVPAGRPAGSHPLRVKVESLYRPCHKNWLVGTFKVSGLHKGQDQIDATTASSAVLLHTFTARKSTVTLRKIALKYQFPKGEPTPSGNLNVYVVQVKGRRQPSAVVPVTVTGCKK